MKRIMLSLAFAALFAPCVGCTNDASAPGNRSNGAGDNTQGGANDGATGASGTGDTADQTATPGSPAGGAPAN